MTSDVTRPPVHPRRLVGGADGGAVGEGWASVGGGAGDEAGGAGGGAAAQGED
jgi:hypothetical protein